MEVDTNLLWQAQKAQYTVRADAAREAQDSAWTQTHFFIGTGRHDEQPPSVPLVPMLFCY